jgi:hypothetical protein
VDIFSAPYINITGIAAKAVGTPLTGVTANDLDIRGFEFVLKDVENINGSVFVYNRLVHGTGPLGTSQGTNANGLAVPGIGSGQNDNLYVYGFRSKVNFGGFTGKLVFAKNSGENRHVAVIPADIGPSIEAPGVGVTRQDGFISAGEGVRPAVGSYTGMAFTLDAEYKAEIEDVASFIPWVHMGWGTGRGNIAENQNEGFTAILSDYRPGTIYGRFAGGTSVGLGSALMCPMGSLGCNSAAANGLNTGLLTGLPALSAAGLNNRIIWGAGLKVTPAFANKLTAAVSYYDFRFQRVTEDNIIWCGATGSTACGTNGSGLYKQTIPNSAVAGAVGSVNNSAPMQDFAEGRGAKRIGGELDFDLTWKHSDNVTFMAGVASFRPGQYIANIISDSADAVTTGAGGTGARVSISPVTIAYGDMHIKF